MLSSISVLTVTRGDAFMGVRRVVSRFRFRAGMTSSMSGESWRASESSSSSSLAGVLWENRAREDRLLRRG